MKKTAFILATLALIISAVSFALVLKDRPNSSLGATDVQGLTMMGSATNYVSVPNKYADANSTTTDPALPEGGGSITQLYPLSGVDTVSLVVHAVGGTATSSVYIRPMFSLDTSSWYFMNTTSTVLINGTTTPGTVSPLVFSYVPGTASSSRAFYFTPPPAQWMRLGVMGDNLATDPDDGIQAYVQLGLEQTY